MILYLIYAHIATAIINSAHMSVLFCNSAAIGSVKLIFAEFIKTKLFVRNILFNRPYVCYSKNMYKYIEAINIRSVYYELIIL